MKLVEILARELEVWPDGCERISQLSTRGLLIDTRIHDAGLDLAEDWDRSTITRPQWQAERDRMSKMEALIEARDNPPSTEPTYEQQLWDRAYADAWRHGFSVLGSDCSTEYFQSMTQASARMADAFMAERAKRVGK